jgi:hypothetical protein
MKQMENNRGWNYLVQKFKIRILPFNFKEEKESECFIKEAIMSNYLEQIVLLLNEILDASRPFEEK